MAERQEQTQRANNNINKEPEAIIFLTDAGVQIDIPVRSSTDGKVLFLAVQIAQEEAESGDCIGTK